MEVKLSSTKLVCCKRTVRQYPPRISKQKKRKLQAPGGENPETAVGALKRSSSYRGVTRHRWTGRFEAHLWDKSSWNDKQHKKGRQVYLGAYDDEASAAKAYDLAALKYWGPGTVINFKLEDYEQQLVEMESISREEYLATLRRKSSGFSRGVSKYRGVARHHHNGRWEARIGRVDGNKYLYLGTFGTQEEAARAYDMAAIEYRGAAAVTNFDLTSYSQDFQEMQGQSKEVFSKLKYMQDGGSSNDLQELGRVAAMQPPTTQAMTGANFGDMIDTFHPFLPVMSTPFVKLETLQGNHPLSCENDGFTMEEFSEMETSGSSDVTSVTEPKEEEEEYDWSQYTSFELPIEDSPQMECESHQRLEFWNGFVNVFPQGAMSADGIDQDSFISNVLEELPPCTS